MKKIRTKLILGISLIFFISFAITVLNMSSNNRIANYSGSLLEDNYPSVIYSFEMVKTLDEINNRLLEIKLQHASLPDSLYQQLTSDFSTLDTLLSKQKANITEIGEEELTAVLSSSYQKYKQSIAEQELIDRYPYYKEKYDNFRKHILLIRTLNIKELEKKNNQIKTSADKTLGVQETAGIIGLLLLGVLITLLPVIVINPIDNLSKRLKAFYQEKFNKDIELETNHELEKLEQLFEKIVEEVENKNEKKI
jgi:HAMP domain-containing protein